MADVYRDFNETLMFNPLPKSNTTIIATTHTVYLVQSIVMNYRRMVLNFSQLGALADTWEWTPNCKYISLSSLPNP